MPIFFRKTQFSGVAAEPGQGPKDPLPEIVLSGRSNVGKSSLINALADQRKLARVSNTPGKTRLVVYFDVDRRFYLTDLPGFGFARVSQQAREKFSSLVDTYLTGNRPIVMVLHLLDVRHEPSDLDHQMLAWLAASNLPYRVILTKCDKLSRVQLTRQIAVIAAALEVGDLSLLLPFSAENRQGVQELRALIAGHFGDTAAD